MSLPGRGAARVVLGTLLAVLAGARPAGASCALPPAVSAAGYLSTPAARYAQALTYADHQCLGEAAALLAEAAAGLSSQTGSRAATLRNLVGAARDYVVALEAMARGDTDAGLSTLQQVVDRGPNAVGLRAALAIGKAVVQDRTTRRWEGIEEALEELSRRGHVQAEFLLIERFGLVRGRAAAIADVERRLDETQDLQRALSLEVLLIELYARDGRLVDAQLLLTVVSRDAADTLLDLEMRKRLLEAGLAVSSALVAQGRPEFRGQREAYEQALAELERFTS